MTFTGPLLRDVLAAVGAKGSKITAVALNVFFNGASDDTSAAVNAARQADAH